MAQVVVCFVFGGAVVSIAGIVMIAKAKSGKDIRNESIGRLNAAIGNYNEEFSNWSTKPQFFAYVDGKGPGVPLIGTPYSATFPVAPRHGDDAITKFSTLSYVGVISVPRLSVRDETEQHKIIIASPNSANFTVTVKMYRSVSNKCACSLPRSYPSGTNFINRLVSCTDATDAPPLAQLCTYRTTLSKSEKAKLSQTCYATNTLSRVCVRMDDTIGSGKFVVGHGLMSGKADKGGCYYDPEVDQMSLASYYGEDNYRDSPPLFSAVTVEVRHQFDPNSFVSSQLSCESTFGKSVSQVMGTGGFLIVGGFVWSVLVCFLLFAKKKREKCTAMCTLLCCWPYLCWKHCCKKKEAGVLANNVYRVNSRRVVSPPIAAEGGRDGDDNPAVKARKFRERLEADRRRREGGGGGGDDVEGMVEQAEGFPYRPQIDEVDDYEQEGGRGGGIVEMEGVQVTVPPWHGGGGGGGGGGGAKVDPGNLVSGGKEKNSNNKQNTNQPQQHSNNKNIIIINNNSSKQGVDCVPPPWNSSSDLRVDEADGQPEEEKKEDAKKESEELGGRGGVGEKILIHQTSDVAPPPSYDDGGSSESDGGGDLKKR